VEINKKKDIRPWNWTEIGVSEGLVDERSTFRWILLSCRTAQAGCPEN